MYNGILMWIIGLIAPVIERPVILGLIGGVGLFFWLSFMKRERKILETFSSIFFAVGLFWLGCWFFVSWFTAYNLKTPLYWWSGSLLLGVIGAFFFERHFLSALEKGISGATKSSGLERDKKTDIRDLLKKATKKPDYSPEKFFKQDAWFLGLEGSKPIYFEKEKLPHLLISGKSGVGKSVLLGVVCAQMIMKGEGGAVFDPKHSGDEYLPDVCRKACEDAGRPFHYIDLRDDAHQLNILEGASPREIEQLLVTIFELEERGDAGDYYRVKDQAMARFVGENFREGDTLASLSREYDAFFTDKKQDANGFAGKMRKISAVNSINAKKGIDLAKIINENGFIYVAGDWLDVDFKIAQRMLLARIIQILGKRNNFRSVPTQFGVVLDEFSFQISKIFANSLKIIRDKGVHFIMAHQSLKDLKEVPENMVGEAFASSVLTNCGLKFTYRSADVETAKYFAELSGEILVDDEIRHLEKSLSMTETVSHDRQVRQTEKFYIDTNSFLTLPEGHGVFFGDGLAKISAVAPIKVEKSTKTRQVKNFFTERKEIEKTLYFKDLEYDE